MFHGSAILLGIIVSVVRAFPHVSGNSRRERRAQGTAEDLQIGADLRSLHFPDNYHATGFLSLPTSNIREPIEVWYSKHNEQSRIDYYHGDVKTFQRGDLGRYGMLFKIVPKYSYKSGSHYTGCWKRRGSKSRKVNAQGILPNNVGWPFTSRVKDFKYVGDKTINGTLCSKWVFQTTVREKNNSYVFYASKTVPPRPVRYEMNGYDILLVSYYDRYVIDYQKFGKWDYDSSRFRVPHLEHDKWCWDISEYLDDDADGGMLALNPLGEFVSPHDSDPVDEDFHDFQRKHGKKYKDAVEHQKRKHIFRHNLRYIRSINRKNLAYKLAANHFTDLTDDEFNSHKGLLEGEGYYDDDDHDSDDDVVDDDVDYDDDDDNDVDDDVDDDGDDKEEEEERAQRRSKITRSIPDQLDWRDYGAVTPAKGQGTCGSCWAFASVGSIEGANFLKTGKLVDLSEQHLLDCTWATPGVRHGNNGCLGGWTWKAFAWVKRFGVATEASYGSYRGQEGYCKTKNLTIGANIDSYRRVKRYDAEALKKAVAFHGPATISINANPKALKFYSHGIMDDMTCNNKTDHAVLLIGYGEQNGVPYWLIKNSWSYRWGNRGFIKIKQGLCGIEKRPFVALNRSGKTLPWKQAKTTKKTRHKRKDGTKATQHKTQNAVKKDTILRRDEITDPAFPKLDEDFDDEDDNFLD